MNLLAFPQVEMKINALKMLRNAMASGTAQEAKMKNAVVSWPSFRHVNITKKIYKTMYFILKQHLKIFMKHLYPK